MDDKYYAIRCRDTEERDQLKWAIKEAQLKLKLPTIAEVLIAALEKLPSTTK